MHRAIGQVFEPRGTRHRRGFGQKFWLTTLLLTWAYIENLEVFEIVIQGASGRLIRDTDVAKEGLELFLIRDVFVVQVLVDHRQSCSGTEYPSLLSHQKYKDTFNCPMHCPIHLLILDKP